MIDNGKLHGEILKHIIKFGYAPDCEEISRIFGCDRDVTVKSLISLQENHGVVLHPNEVKIWVIHPFSLAPTNFVVRSKRGIWWGNCAWCSLGAAAILNEDVRITTNIGAHEQQVVLTISNGKLANDDLYVHFPISMKKAWDNVIFTCSNMLIFRNEMQIDEWTKRHNIPKGDVQPIQKIWNFSKVWYGNHLNPDWKKWTTKEAKEIFEKYELKGNTWDLDVSGARF